MPNIKPSPNHITSLQPDEVFVYGANLAGRHGKGAAKQALKFGARIGVIDRCGQTFGIPTKNANIITLNLNWIRNNVNIFIIHANKNPNDKFLVTEIGCGLAGYTPRDIAPFFQDAPNNVYLPQSFLDVLCSQS